MKNTIIRRNDKATLVLLGIENQTMIHYAMPVRNMLYDALQYSEQIRTYRKMHRKNRDLKSGEEFLTGLKKEDRIIPVITLVVYFGLTPWDGPGKLSEMFAETDEQILRHIQDYRIAILEPEQMEDGDFEKFSTELGRVLKFVKHAGNEQQIDRILNKNDDYKHLSRKAVRVLNSCANLKINLNKEAEEIDMCKAWEDHKKAGIEEGIKQGKEEGIEQGIKQGKEELVKKMYTNGMSVEEISIITEISLSHILQIIEE